MDQQLPVEALRLFEETWEEAHKAFLAAHEDFADKLANARQTLRSCAGNVEKHKANLEQLAETAKARVADVRALVEGSSGNAEAEEKLKAAEAALVAQAAEIAAANDAARQAAPAPQIWKRNLRMQGKRLTPAQSHLRRRSRPSRTQRTQAAPLRSA